MFATAATLTRIGLVGRMVVTSAVLALATAATAQTPKVAKTRSAVVAAAPIADAVAQAPFVNGHRIAPTPSWVLDIDAPTRVPTPATPGPGYRVLLSDVQTRLDAPGEQQQYVRSRLVATDGTALAEVSKAELHFNPAYQ